jgi:hypothetical protein
LDNCWFYLEVTLVLSIKGDRRNAPFGQDWLLIDYLLVSFEVALASKWHLERCLRFDSFIKALALVLLDCLRLH